ncbi:MAG TPA: hypothetical protein VGF97_15105 [Rhizomicrobium sp.]|jgi:hypothetical protein
MSFPTAMEWGFGILAAAGALWTLVKSVHIRVRVNVRRLNSDDPVAAAGEPKLSVDTQTHYEHGGLIRFGKKTGAEH